MCSAFTAPSAQAGASPRYCGNTSSRDSMPESRSCVRVVVVVVVVVVDVDDNGFGGRRVALRLDESTQH